MTHMVIVSQFLQLEGQSDGYIDARMWERNTYNHGGIVLEPRRTWANGDVVPAIVSLAPTVISKPLRDVTVNKNSVKTDE